ncbi:MAG: 2,3-diphosphoglycerate-dependent phosphoglycerate mutase [Muribaculaceae bacterium]|nr:2,3-diphosphoglycerate-dependent phosphoglycerate mutase [Muribaculaceae bacterium]
MRQIILLRHGQSLWNLENRFTGWTDVDLTDRGREEARAAGEKIAAAGIRPEFFFTSYQKRAIHTLQIAADAMDLAWVPVIKDWHLNERHYGGLQGLNKAETAKKYGDGQVHLWRRSYDIAPPTITPDDERHPSHDPRYAGIPADRMPAGESLKDTIERVRPCWEEIIVPKIGLYDTVLIAAHGNSLRALVMMLKKMTPDEIISLEIPTGAPWLFQLDDRMNVIAERYL